MPMQRSLSWSAATRDMRRDKPSLVELDARAIARARVTDLIAAGVRPSDDLLVAAYPAKMARDAVVARLARLSH